MSDIDEVLKSAIDGMSRVTVPQPPKGFWANLKKLLNAHPPVVSVKEEVRWHPSCCCL